MEKWNTVTPQERELAMVKIKENLQQKALVARRIRAKMPNVNGIQAMWMKYFAGLHRPILDAFNSILSRVARDRKNPPYPKG